MNGTLAKIAMKADVFEFSHPRVWAVVIGMGGLLLLASGMDDFARAAQDKRTEAAT